MEAMGIFSAPYFTEFSDVIYIVKFTECFMYMMKQNNKFLCTERLKLCCILNKLCRMALTMVTETSYIVLLKVIHICMPVCI